MQLIISIALLLSAISATMLTLVVIRNNRKRSGEAKRLLRFSELGTENNLSFTSQEILNNSIIGLDGLKRKMLFLQETNGIYHWLIIDLNTVNHCSVKFKYRGFRLGRKKATGVYFEKLFLRFQSNDGQLIDLPFYANTRIKLSLRRQLQQKARHWEAILSKMIVKKQTGNALTEVRQMS